MGRPRVFVRIVEQPDGTVTRVEKGGREIHGLSFNKSNRTYYTIDDSTGKRQYLGRDLANALRHIQGPDLNVPGQPDTWTPEYEAKLADESANLQSHVKAVTKVTDELATMSHAQVLSLAEKLGYASPTKPSSHKLLDCLNVWIDYQRDNDAHELRNIQPNAQRFRLFVKQVGNLPITSITFDDFLKWQRYVTRNMKTAKNPNYWHNKHHATVKAVLKLAKRKRPDWPLPSELMDWADSYDKKRAKPAEENALKMPLAEFRKLLDFAEKMSQTEIPPKINEEMTAKTAKYNRQRQLAKSTVRRGYQYKAMLYMAAQTGFGWADFEQLTHEHIKMQGKLTYVDLPRTKSSKLSGQVVNRRIPLLPSTLKTLNLLKPLNNSDHVFITDKGLPMSASRSTEWRTFSNNAGVTDWNFKHLRNIGSNLADENGLDSRVINRFHGRVIGGAIGSYLEQSLKPDYLIQLVNIIGREYFEREQIKQS